MGGPGPDRLYPLRLRRQRDHPPPTTRPSAIWNEEIGIPAERIFKFGKEDNFWEHGSGPCGPCSEIYYDRGEQYGCGKPGCTVGCDCDRYMEVWNVVFSQFDNDGEGHYTELKQKNIDTGMGLERLACVCQGRGLPVRRGHRDEHHQQGHRDHRRPLRGEPRRRLPAGHHRPHPLRHLDDLRRRAPSNEGRGYVLRRLLRRAARHGKLLGSTSPFLYEVCDTVIHENGGPLPRAAGAQDYITKVIRVEEENFAKTIDGGLKIFSEMLEATRPGGSRCSPALTPSSSMTPTASPST